MSKNVQPLIAGAGVLGGLALLGFVFSIQRDPLAWTSAAAPAAAAPVAGATPLAPPAPAPHHAPNDSSPSKGVAPRASAVGVVELPPVRITSSKSRVPSVARQSGASEPCSAWREIGPAYVEEGQPRGTRRVRDLC